MTSKNKPLKFNREKAVEVIIYLAKKLTVPNYYSILKLIYFADKTSLERFGRFIFGESYYAMPKGPVPSNAYDLIKEANGSSGFVVEDQHTIRALREADLDELSDSDIACLDSVIELYGDLPGWHKGDLSHDDAYHAAWSERGNRTSVPMSIEHIARMFDEADELIEHLHYKDTE